MRSFLGVELLIGGEQLSNTTFLLTADSLVDCQYELLGVLLSYHRLTSLVLQCCNVG